MLAAILCNLAFRETHGGDTHDGFLPGDYSAWIRSAERRRLRKPEQMERQELEQSIRRLMTEAPQEVASEIIENLAPALRTETGINWAAFLADLANVAALLALYERLLAAHSITAVRQRAEAQRMALLMALAAAEEYDRQATLRFLEVFSAHL